MTPGPDNTLGTADDIPLVGFRRRDRHLRRPGQPEPAPDSVTIRYNGSTAVGSPQRTYTLITYISSFS